VRYVPGLVPQSALDLPEFLRAELGRIAIAMLQGEAEYLVLAPQRVVPAKNPPAGALYNFHDNVLGPGKKFGLYEWDGTDWLKAT
jgi:hypothetical protein